jgi:hypothetical protein
VLKTVSDGRNTLLAVTAIRLVGRWAKLVGRHVAFDTYCSCSGGPCSVRVQEYEQDILDYLYEKHRGLESPVARDLFIVGAAYRRRAAGSVQKLLQAIAIREAHGAAECRELLVDLEHAIDSFERLDSIG